MTSLPSIKTINDLFQELDFGEKIEKKKIDLLLRLTINGEQMFSLDSEKFFLTEAVFLIKSMGFDKSYEYFKSQQKTKDRKNIIRNCEYFKNSKRRAFLEITKDLRVEKVESYIKCPKCKGHEVDTESRQTRSADEAQTDFHACRICNHKWVN